MFEGWINGLTRGYARSLKWLLERRWIVVIVWFITAGVGGCFSSRCCARSSHRWRIAVSSSAACSLRPGDRRLHLEQLRPVEQHLSTIPEAAAYNAIAGFPSVDYGTAVLRLKPWEERQRKQQDIARQLNQQLQTLPGIIGFAVNPPSLGQSGRSLPVEYVIMAQMPYADLDRITQEFIAEISKTGIVQTPQSDLRLNTPELRVDVNRDKLGDLGIPVETVGRTLQPCSGVSRSHALRGTVNNTTSSCRSRRATAAGRTTSVTSTFARATARWCSLQTWSRRRRRVADVREPLPTLRAVTITSNLAPGYTIGDALKMWMKRRSVYCRPTL